MQILRGVFALRPRSVFAFRLRIFTPCSPLFSAGIRRLKNFRKIKPTSKTMDIFSEKNSVTISRSVFAYSRICVISIGSRDCVENGLIVIGMVFRKKKTNEI